MNCNGTCLLRQCATKAQYSPCVFALLSYATPWDGWRCLFTHRTTKATRDPRWEIPMKTAHQKSPLRIMRTQEILSTVSRVPAMQTQPFKLNASSPKCAHHNMRTARISHINAHNLHVSLHGVFCRGLVYRALLDPNARSHPNTIN